MPSESGLVKQQQTLYESRNPTRKWLHNSRREWIISAIKTAAAKKHGWALEVGFGSGVYLSVLSEQYDHVVASDIEESYLVHAEPLTTKHPNLTLLIDDITKTKLPDRSFDLVVCSEVIEHIADSFSVITGIYRLLKPGGILILSTPQKYSLIEVVAKIAFLPGIINLVKALYGESVSETGHITLLSDGEILQQLKKSGFRVCETFKSGLYLPFIAEFLGVNGLRLEKWLEGKLRGGVFDAILWTQYYVAEA